MTCQAAQVGKRDWGALAAAEMQRWDSSVVSCSWGDLRPKAFSLRLSFSLCKVGCARIK